MAKLLLNVIETKQATAKSCWACSTRAVMGLHGVTKFTTDQILADAVKKDVSDYADVEQVLKHFGMDSNQDERCFPKYDEIKIEIDNNKPMITCVVGRKPTSRQKSFQRGHYVVIVGYDDGPPAKIAVMDPDDGQNHWVEYDDLQFKKPNTHQFWAVTYYTTAPKINLP